MYKFGVNTYAYSHSSTAEACVRRPAALGFDTVELMVSPGHLWPTDGCGRYRSPAPGRWPRAESSSDIDFRALAGPIDQALATRAPILEIIDEQPDLALQQSANALLTMGY